ncbi:unnamed protein product [Ceutorhynchus assimilis]|uniref:acid phosphatase n=1 Tax=Ceutorhynchus assimilis TaxID=467358 RepID=A0A9N9QAH7_9CUCU|nr:unnamed protein product [Ceutorhynchus assimilis]
MQTLILVIVLALISQLVGKPALKEKSTLRLLHVLFRHGNRNPEETSMWSSNSFSNASNYPEGWGQLTNKGKMTEYKLGQFYRERYDQFLGDTWNIDYVDFRCDNYDRTKMSGELVMAGLWPPRGANVWNKGLAWQPIPFEYVPLNKDPLLYPIVSVQFQFDFALTFLSGKIQSHLAKKYGEAMKILSQNTGCSATNYAIGSAYYDTMMVQEDLGFKLDSWTTQVYPEPLKSLAVDIFYVMTNNTVLRKKMAGSLLKKVITDTYSLIHGTLSPPTRKMFVYSAHDTNVGSMYLSLQAYKMDQPPPYGSSFIFEVHEIEGVWGLKLFLVDYTKGSPHSLTIPGCEEFCPIDEFYSLVDDILPLD